MYDPANNGELTERINDRYWNSESTVGEISKDLEVGRNTLYAAVKPISSGSSCPECGEETVFTNRTNRSAGAAVCRSCEEGTGMGAPRASTASRPRSDRYLDSDDDGDSELEGWSRWRRDLRSVPPQRAAMIGGAAALGLVVGAVTVRLIRSS
jgi:transcription elongation factor Elf1